MSSSEIDAVKTRYDTSLVDACTGLELRQMRSREVQCNGCDL